MSELVKIKQSSLVWCTCLYEIGFAKSKGIKGIVWVKYEIILVGRFYII